MKQTSEKLYTMIDKAPVLQNDDNRKCRIVGFRNISSLNIAISSAKEGGKDTIISTMGYDLLRRIRGGRGRYEIIELIVDRRFISSVGVCLSGVLKTAVVEPDFKPKPL